MAAICVAVACAERPPYLFIEECGVLSGLARDLLIVGVVKNTKERNDAMKAKKTARKTTMTDAEIKEAIRRDKEWMNNLSPEDEIEIPEGWIKGLFGDDDEDSADNDSEEFDAEGELGEDDADDAEDDETDDGDDDDDDVDTSGVGGMLGALVGGIGGIVIGGILGTALFDD